MSARATTIAVVGIALTLAACAREIPIRAIEPCGVIRDSLLEVEATDREGQQRLDDHFERGVNAKCWDRTGKLIK